jgi:hypothetical protein
LADALLQQGAGELLARILPDAPFRAESS